MFENLSPSLQAFFAQFAKQTYTMDDIFAMQESGQLPKVIVYAIPVMLGFVILEFILSQIHDREVYVGKDFFASLAVGIGNLLSTAAINVVMFGIILAFYNFVPWTIPITWWGFLLCIVFLDFARYWAHRVAHEQRFWWATHVTHHSSELYNFSVSFRLSWVQQIKLVFFLPVALMGFHPVVFFICHQVEVLYQFWIHTEFIRKLPKPIEYIFTTPSHHRVHHAVNKGYIDKNYGSTFIIWDRIFGTFQPEGEQAIYGITKPPESYNPVYLVFHEFIDIAKDLKHADNFKDRWTILFGYPGSYTKRLDDLKAKELAEGVEAPVNKVAA